MKDQIEVEIDTYKDVAYIPKEALNFKFTLKDQPFFGIESNQIKMAMKTKI